MKKTIKLLFAPLICILIFSNVSAQVKNCDLAIRFTAPVEDSVYAFGDTIKIFFMVKNNGPDNISINDTVDYSFLISSSSLPPTSIPAGDSVIVGPIGAVNNSDSISDVNMLCLQLLPSNAYNDPDTSNDKNCVTFVLEGSSTGIAAIHQQVQPLHLYPNPATSETTLPLQLNKPAHIVISISDLLGRTLWQKDYGRLSGTQNIRLDIAKLNPGLYIIELDKGKTMVLGKLIVR
jgi:hypothetical protein